MDFTTTKNYADCSQIYLPGQISKGTDICSYIYTHTHPIVFLHKLSHLIKWHQYHSVAQAAKLIVIVDFSEKLLEYKIYTLANNLATLLYS